jgi:hypothetical protein
MKVSICLLAVLLSMPAVICPALQLSSLQPAAAAPGTAVTLIGSDWPEEFQLLLGETSIRYERISVAAILFLVPEQPPGDYAVSISSDGGRLATAPFNLRILPREPLIQAVNPDQFPFCRQGGEEELVVSGEHFAPAAQLLLDDSTLAVKARSQSSMTAVLPRVPAGLHRLQVVNPDGRKSLAATLSIVDQPVIDFLDIGTEQVNTYQIRILGNNFSPQSRLLLNGKVISNRSDDLAEGRDRFSFIDCATLLYQRYPLTGQPRELAFQVLNPDGQISNTYVVTAN